MILIPFSIQRLYILENLETKKEKKKKKQPLFITLTPSGN